MTGDTGEALARLGSGKTYLGLRDFGKKLTFFYPVSFFKIEFFNGSPRFAGHIDLAKGRT